MHNSRISINRQHGLNLMGKVVGRVAGKSAKFAYRTVILGSAVASPFLGFGLGVYVSRQMGIPVSGGIGKSAATSFLIAMPWVSTSINYGLARLEVLVRTSPRIRRNDLSQMQLAKVEVDARKANEFYAGATTMGILWSYMLPAILTGAEVGRPFGLGATLLGGAGGMAGSLIAAVASYNPIERHLNCRVEENLNQFPERSNMTRYRSHLFRSFVGRHNTL